MIPARSQAVVLLLACLALTTPVRAQVSRAATTYVPQKPVVTVTVTPNPTVNKPAELHATITPPVANIRRYEFFIDGKPLTDCLPNVAKCEWRPTRSGPHEARAIAYVSSTGRGGRASPLERIEGRPTPVQVQPEPVVTPVTQAPDRTPPVMAPLPELTLKLLSSSVVAGEPARFAVSLLNAEPFEYGIDLGTGKFETRTDAEVTHSFEHPGDVLVVARFPANAPAGTFVVYSRLAITIEAAPPPPPPPPPVALTVRADPKEASVGTAVTLVIATGDGRPMVEYTLDVGDGSQPVRQSLDSFVVSYSRPDTYTVTVTPVDGPAGAATTAITITSSFPWLILVLVVIGVIGIVIVAKVMSPPTPPPTPEPPPTPLVPTFHPNVEVPKRFSPSRTKGIALEVHYVPNLASLRYSRRVRISPET